MNIMINEENIDEFFRFKSLIRSRGKGIKKTYYIPVPKVYIQDKHLEPETEYWIYLNKIEEKKD